MTRGARLSDPIEPLPSPRDAEITASCARRLRCAALGLTSASQEEARAPQIQNCASIVSTIAALRASIVGNRRADCRATRADCRNRHGDRAATSDPRLRRRADCPQSWLLRPRSPWVPRPSRRRLRRSLEVARRPTHRLPPFVAPFAAIGASCAAIGARAAAIVTTIASIASSCEAKPENCGALACPSGALVTRGASLASRAAVIASLSGPIGWVRSLGVTRRGRSRACTRREPDAGRTASARPSGR